jgi:hypothetical protein
MTLRAFLRVLVVGAVAVMCGSAFTALAFFLDSAESWGLEERYASGFLLTYALSLAGSAPAQVIFALALWLVARALSWRRRWQWAVLGAVLGVLVTFALSRLGDVVEGTYFAPQWQRVKSALMFPLMGPMMFAVRPVWVAAAVGAATALVLHLVARPSRAARSAARSVQP